MQRSAAGALNGSGVTTVGPGARLLDVSASLSRRDATIPGARVNVGTMGYFDLMRMWAACSEGASDRQCIDIAPQSFGASSTYVSKKLSSAGRSAFVAAADTGATLVCDSYGGKINDVSPSATALVHRGARFSVQIVSYAPITTAKTRMNSARAQIATYGNGQHRFQVTQGIRA